MISHVKSYWQETHKELVKWKAMTEQRLTGILTSLKGVQVPNLPHHPSLSFENLVGLLL